MKDSGGEEDFFPPLAQPDSIPRVEGLDPNSLSDLFRLAGEAPPTQYSTPADEEVLR